MTPPLPEPGDSSRTPFQRDRRSPSDTACARSTSSVGDAASRRASGRSSTCAASPAHGETRSSTRGSSRARSSRRGSRTATPSSSADAAPTSRARSGSQCLRVAAFRSYAARMGTPEWQEALAAELGQEAPCFMCAESHVDALPPAADRRAADRARTRGRAPAGARPAGAAPALGRGRDPRRQALSLRVARWPSEPLGTTVRPVALNTADGNRRRDRDRRRPRRATRRRSTPPART